MFPMHIAVAFGQEGHGLVQPLPADGAPPSPSDTDDLAGVVAELERRHHPRWVFDDTAGRYPRLLRRGVRLDRCHDVALTDALLRGGQGHHDGSHSLDAVHARLRGLPEPAPVAATATTQDTLFDTAPPVDARADLTRLVEVFADQASRLERLPRLRLLAAAESAGALVAAEMTHVGLPWRVDVHDAVLTELLGPKPVRGMRPKRLQQLADEVSAALGVRLNPDSPSQLLSAFHAAGHPIDSTHSWVLGEVDHPAVAPLLEYKKLSRVFAGHGWSWMTEWVTPGPQGPDSPARRFRPRYVVAGVPTGRWATDGGAALQIPRVLRKAVQADDGHLLVVADAAQLEPRMLAAVSGDPGMITATEADDMYAALAPTFGGERGDAKLALLSAMYGGTAGNATTLLSVLRRRFGSAHTYVEEAARAGERGELVHTWLGRTCPPPPPNWWDVIASDSGTRAARDRGRFTRNFVIQGTAAEWASAMMAVLRKDLRRYDAGDLVFFQHDEIIVHSPHQHVDLVSRLIQQASDTATGLLFGDTRVRVPLRANAVRHYSEAK